MSQAGNTRSQQTTSPYPVAEKAADSLEAASGRKLSTITLEAAANGELDAADLQISAATLRTQAEVAAAAGYDELAQNLLRAAELTAVPNADLLKMYEVMRPGRSTYQELSAMADRLEHEFAATITAGFVREAAEVYRARNLLRRRVDYRPSAMTTLLAQLAPQRSTQYADLVATLAPHELALSPLGKQIGELTPLELAGQSYLRFDLPALPTAEQAQELGALASVSAFFELAEQLDNRPGPWLRPLETGFVPTIPPEMAAARRYRGKTNELLCHFLCNLARASSNFATTPWGDLRVFDPLAGGGTILFTALMLGAEAAGVEEAQQDVRTTVAYVRQFCQEMGIPCRVQEERLRKLGRRTVLTVGKTPPRRCILAQGDTAQSAALLSGFKPHLIVTDLPYGIQHHGPLVDLLTRSVPVWTGMLPPGGALVFAWDATRFARADMLALVETVAPVVVLNTPPYDQLAHRVDRVIKQRDLLVARRP